MFDLGLTELLLIGIVALIIVGPKDLPVLFRRVGEFVGRMKGMAREFTSAMNDAADEAGVKDVAKTMRAATNPIKTGCLLYTSPSPRDKRQSRMPSSA